MYRNFRKHKAPIKQLNRSSSPLPTPPLPLSPSPFLSFEYIQKVNWAEIEGLSNPNSWSEKDFGLNAQIAKSVQDDLETCAMSLGMICCDMLCYSYLFLSPSFLLFYLLIFSYYPQSDII